MGRLAGGVPVRNRGVTDRQYGEAGGMWGVKTERDVQGAAPAMMAARLRHYWQGLRSGDALPRRHQFVPRDMAPLLAALCLIDRTDSGAARFRIAGRALQAVYGMELGGAPVALLFEPSQRAEMAAILGGVLAGAESADLDLRAEARAGRPALHARLLLLPLADHAGKPALAIGTLEVAGEVGQSPRRFYIERCLRSPLVPKGIRLGSKDGSTGRLRLVT